MSQSIALFTIVVKDYDEAIQWYTSKLNFTIVEDLQMPDKRWVVIAPPGASSDATKILLAKPSKPEQEAFVGNQGGGRVMFFLQTTDFHGDMKRMIENDVKIVREAKEMPYGWVLVFEDLYGNKWDFLSKKTVDKAQEQPTKKAKTEE